MPRYRVILEFDHPGDDAPTPGGDTTRAPDKWNWTEILTPDAKNLTARVFVKSEWEEITRGT